MEKQRYMISDAAAAVNVESHVLRYWEEELELTVPRNEMGHRYYTKENINEFLKIKELKELGYQLKAIKMILHNENVEGIDVGQIPPEQLNARIQNQSHGMPRGVQMGGGMRQEMPMQTERIVQQGGQVQMQNVFQETQMQPGAVPQQTQIQTTQQAYMQQSSAGIASNTYQGQTKLDQFQDMMTQIVKQAINENNGALGKEVGEQVGERVLKEMNYLMREADEQEEERYRKLDEAIRSMHKRKDKKGKLFGKKRELKPNEAQG